MKITVAIIVLASCATTAYLAGQSRDKQPVLKDAVKGLFLVGAAVNESQFTERNAMEAAIVKRQFNTITPENVMKWQEIHPGPDEYKFGPADRYVEFGEKNGMFVVGHNLIWHQQTPKWVWESEAGGPATKDELLHRMRNHIQTVVGRYKGRIRGWDVVDEDYRRGVSGEGLPVRA
jgi:endo-1,4-beta-xylanase